MKIINKLNEEIIIHFYLKYNKIAYVVARMMQKRDFFRTLSPIMTYSFPTLEGGGVSVLTQRAVVLLVQMNPTKWLPCVKLPNMAIKTNFKE